MPEVELGAQPAGLPARQHAWTAYARRDQHGNPVPPRFDRLLFFDVVGTPHAGLRAAARGGAAHARAHLPVGAVRAAVHRRLGPGLLRATCSGSPRRSRAARRSRTSSSPRSTTTTSASTSPATTRRGWPRSRRRSSTAALPDYTDAAEPLDLSARCGWRETRTGFVGTGLPAEHQHTGGIPAGEPVPVDAPLFMGFKSALKQNQATEDAVTIADGPFAGGTTMHVSYMRLRLDSWYASSRAASGWPGCTPRRSPRSRWTTSPPTRRATPTCSARRSAATA